MSSSFSASIAHIRHLDRPGERHYAYCAAAANRNATLTLQEPADRVTLHTCKASRKRAGLQQAPGQPSPRSGRRAEQGTNDLII